MISLKKGRLLVEKIMKVLIVAVITCCFSGCASVTNLNKTAGIKEAKVDFKTKKATLIFDAKVLSPNEVTQVVRNTGGAYTVTDFKVLN